MRKTNISFGLVNIPININPIIQDNDITFNQLHKKCLSRIKYIKYCPHCKKEVKQEEIIKGYKISDNDYITLTNSELKSLQVTNEDNIEIIGFINSLEIDPIFYEKSYVITITKKSKAYSLFKDALEKSKKVAIAKTVIATKFYYVAIRVKNNHLLMSTLYFNEEINLPEASIDAKYTKKELDLAMQLIKSLNMKFNPEKYIDEYQENIKEAIIKKEKGTKIKPVKAKKNNNIKDLMQALELSLKNV
ncbi:MAG: Ku protein [Bacilli bacterium]